MKQPTEAPDPFFFLRTLAPSVWYTSMSVFLFLGICIFVTLRLINNIKKKQRSNDTEPPLSVMSCLIITTAGFCNQGNVTTRTSDIPADGKV